ncbi:MAG TPA: hypothetical protein PLP17_12795, partial [Oligoflexia bacterium]|nr:hypothetical protein [Oligoflexia bacterium]
LKSEFAFRDKDVDPSCKRFCPNQIQADPFYAQMFGTMGMIDAAAVGFLDIIGAVMSNDTMRSLSDPVCQDETASEHPFPDDRICPVFKAGDYTTCMTNYCDYQGLADAGCDLSRSVLHCKNDYQPLNVSVGGFSSGTIDQQKMYVDLSAAPGSSYVRGAEPLFSILNGIHYAARVFRRWGKGDQIGLLAFDWELFPDAANKLSRIFLLSQDYTALIEATDPKVTPAKAADSAKSSLFSRFLFSRGTVQPNNEIYPLGDWNDVTDMQPAMDRTFELLDNAQVPNTKSFAMLFTDGLPNCTGSAAEPVSNRCLTVEYYWRLAVERLFSAGSTGGVPHYAEKRMPVHVVLYDVEVGAHTLNLTTSDTATADCMRDRIARLNQLPYTYDDCASQEYLDVIDDTFHTAHEMLGQAGACGDLTIGEPHMRGVGYISTGNFLGFLFDPPALEALNEYMSCCAQEANVSACMVGFLTALECKDPCCALYAATTLLGASRYYKNQVFYGPNDAFYRVAKE